jgi:pyruvate dehydrogenase E1 component alpha subunit/2-oxoisovalerate dehydrogenase E1 component alpha subunit
MNAADAAVAGLVRVLGEDGALLDARGEQPEPSLVLALHRHMRRVRRLDERMVLLQRQGRIGFYGACTGQEAPPVAAALALAPGDWVFPALREGAILLVRGLALETYLAQAFGSSADIAKGRQMPSHPASRRQRHVSFSSAIGTQLPHAVGAALAARRLGRADVMLAFLGDGATSHPDFHAALNFAGVFRAPVVFVCQNNQYAISVPVARQTASSTLAVKALAYGVEAERVDGNDALAVHTSLARALASARAGGGPRFVECVTYRIGPHSSSDDPDRYRDASEVEAFRAKDPIARLSRYIARQGLGPAELDAEIEVELDAELDRVLPGVEAVPPPPLTSLFDDVYAALPWHLDEQRAAALAARVTVTFRR